MTLADVLESFPVQDDRHLLTVLRYVEANAVRTHNWHWGSLAVRMLDEPQRNWALVSRSGDRAAGRKRRQK